MKSARLPTSRSAQLGLLAVLLVIGGLIVATLVIIGNKRAASTMSEQGQDMSLLNRGLVGQGFGSPVATGGTAPVADIAADLVSKAFSFTPAKYTTQVAAAKRLMTAAMQAQYTEQLATQKVQAAVKLGLMVTTSLIHLDNDPKKLAFVGVTSLTQTQGRFLMYVQRQTTTAGSKQAQVSQFILDVNVIKIGNTWMLSQVNTL